MISYGEAQLVRASFLAKCKELELETIHDFDTDTYFVGVRVKGRDIEDYDPKLFPKLDRIGKAIND